MGIIKSGKVVIVLAGKYAGRKAVVVKTYDSGSEDRNYPHALIAGLAKPPKRVTRKMSKKKIEKRAKVTAFVRYYNLTHLMPTRYTADFDLKAAFDENQLNEDKKPAKNAITAIFNERYVNQGAIKSEKKVTGTKYFYEKMRF